VIKVLPNGESLTLADFLSRWAEYNTLIRLLLKAEASPANIQNPSMAARLADCLGISYWETGLLVQATNYLEKARKINEELGYEDSAVGSMINMGLVQDYQGNNAQAFNDFRAAYRRSKRSVSALVSTRTQAIAAVNYGEAYLKRGDKKGAKPYLAEALKMAQANRYRDVEGYALCCFGDSYRNRNDAMAIENYIKSLQAFADTDYRRGRARAWNNLGLIYKAKYQVISLACLLKAETLRANISDPQSVEARGNILSLRASMTKENQELAEVFAIREGWTPPTLKQAARQQLGQVL